MKMRLAAIATLSALLTGCSGAGMTAPDASSARTAESLGSGAFLTVSVAQPLIAVTQGTTQTFACEMTVAAGDPGDRNYIVSAWGSGTVRSGTGEYPVFNAPAASDVAYSLDGSTQYAPLPNSGLPGMNLFVSSPPVDQTHCLNLSVSAPPSVSPGTYALSIEFHLGARRQFAILQNLVTTTATVMVKVIR